MTNSTTPRSLSSFSLRVSQLTVCFSLRLPSLPEVSLSLPEVILHDNGRRIFPPIETSAYCRVTVYLG